MTRVLCLGDLMVDVVARLSSRLAIGSDTPAPISLLGGGSAANTAAWLAASGLPTTFIGRVGDDALGRAALVELARAGLELAVSVDPDRPTGTCIVLVERDGERTMIPCAGANAGEARLPDRMFDDEAHLHISAYAVFGEGSRRGADAAVSLATERGCRLSVDAASAAPLRAFGANDFLGWLPRCLLFANLDEAGVLTGSDDPATAAAELATRCGEAIVKCGADGAVWSDGHAVLHEIARPAEVIDSTGAGDAFAAGALAARIAGGEPSDSLRSGNALAGRAIAVLGARPSRDQERR